MSDSSRNPDDAADAARRLLEQSVEKRVDAVRSIVAAANHTDTARAALSDAETQHTKAWNSALTAGWTEKELRATGAPRPSQTPARTTRPRKTPTPVEAHATEPSGDDS